MVRKWLFPNARVKYNDATPNSGVIFVFVGVARLLVCRDRRNCRVHTDRHRDPVVFLHHRYRVSALDLNTLDSRHRQRHLVGRLVGQTFVGQRGGFVQL